MADSARPDVLPDQAEAELPEPGGTASGPGDTGGRAESDLPGLEVDRVQPSRDAHGPGARALRPLDHAPLGVLIEDDPSSRSLHRHAAAGAQRPPRPRESV